MKTLCKEQRLCYTHHMAKNKGFQFKPIHFMIVLAIDLVVLAAAIIPQRGQLVRAKALLAQREQELLQIKTEYRSESENLDFMKSDSYLLQQGTEKYGWHYPGDTIFYDDPSAMPVFMPTALPGLNSPTPLPVVVPTPAPETTSEPLTFSPEPVQVPMPPP